MKFDEFSPGTVITAEPVALRQDEIVEFAQRWDPQWFHTDPDRARDGRFGTLIASGWQTCALAMRQAVLLALGGSESFASPGVKYIKWPAPVKAGDRLTFRAEVLGTRHSARKPSLGIVDWRWELLHEDGRQALELEVTSLFDLEQRALERSGLHDAGGDRASRGKGAFGSTSVCEGGIAGPLRVT